MRLVFAVLLGASFLAKNAIADTEGTLFYMVCEQEKGARNTTGAYVFQQTDNSELDGSIFHRERYREHIHVGPVDFRITFLPGVRLDQTRYDNLQAVRALLESSDAYPRDVQKLNWVGYRDYELYGFFPTPDDYLSDSVVVDQNTGKLDEGRVHLGTGAGKLACHNGFYVSANDGV